MGEQIDGVPVSSGTVRAAMSDDGSGLVLTRHLARVLGEPHAGADGCHRDEPSPFGQGDLVGTVGAVCAVAQLRPDCGPPGVSAIHKAAVEGPVAVNALGILTDQQADRAHHGGLDKALYVMSGAEARHWSRVLGGIEPGALGENMLIESSREGRDEPDAADAADAAVAAGIDDVEIGAELGIGQPGRGIRVRVTGVRNPCSTFARGMGRADWVDAFSTRNRVGVYMSVLQEGSVQAGDEVRVLASPGHGVTCRRWFAHHDPRDARAMLASHDGGECVIAEFTRKYAVVAAGEQVGRGGRR